MKRTFIVLSFMVAVCMLFAAAKVSTGQTSTSCTSSPGFGSFQCKGYMVQTVPCSGAFPCIQQNGTDASGNPIFQSVYKYTITQINPKADLINWADILIPVCEPSPSSYSCTALPCSGDLFTNASGDPLTGFGLGLTTDNTWEWNWTIQSKGKGVTGGTVSLTLPGIQYASPGGMLLKLGLLDFRYPVGQILAPSCSATSQASSSSVPLTTQREINFGGINICLESTNQSSCPTTIYSCSVSGDVCACPSASQQIWAQVNLGISAGHLNQVWTNSDPICPITLLHTESCPCSSCAVVGGIPVCYTFKTKPPCSASCK